MKKQITLALMFGFLLLCAAAWGSQNNLFAPVTGTLSGLTLVQDINNANDALATCNSGGSAPTTQFLSGAPSNSNCWDDTSTAGWIKHKIYMAGNWVVTAYYDLTNSLYVGIVGGGVPQNITAASTTDLCSMFPAHVQIVGSASITSFGSTCQTGQWKRFYFASGSAPTLVNSGNLFLPTGANIVGAPGDTGDAVYYGSGIWLVTSYQRATGAALSTAGLNIGASALGNSALAFAGPVNLGLTASIGSSQLTVTITGANGSAPSSSNPVLIPFRSATAATGTPTIDSVQSPVSMTVGSSFTMGCTSAVACRIWIYAIDNAGAVLLGLQTCSSATQIFSCSDDLLYSTNANNNGTNLNGVLASAVASLSGKAVRLIGYLEVTEATAGTWATAPSKIQLFGPGVKKPGDVIQTVFASNATPASTSSNSPQTFLSQALTPTSAANLIRVDAGATVGATNVQTLQAQTQLYRGSTPLGVAQYVACTAGGCTTQAVTAGTSLQALDQPNSTSSQTYAVKYLSSNGVNTVTTDAAQMIIQEIMGALECPANDNGAPLSMVG
jgi:hypothetical protein